MNAQAYLKLQERQREELDNFPIAFAFSEEQLVEALKKLGATKEECVTLANCGDVIKKVDVPAFEAMTIRHKQEIFEFLKDKEAAEEAFLYEMDNHEYAINWSGDEDVLACFNLNYDKLEKMGLLPAYLNARKKHMKHAEKWGMI